RFGQVPGYCTDGLRVALPTGDTFIKTTDVTSGRTPTGQADRVRRLDECPFEIAVDVGASRPEAHLPAARVDTGGRARVAGQLLGGRKSSDLPDLKGDHHGQREPDAPHGPEPLNPQPGPAPCSDASLGLASLPVQAPDLLEKLLAGVGCVRRQQCEALPQEFTTPRPEDIADLVVMQRVLRQGGVAAGETIAIGKPRDGQKTARFVASR